MSILSHYRFVLFSCFFLITYFTSFPNCQGQEVKIVSNSRVNAVGYISKFEDRYDIHQSPQFLLTNTGFYKLKKVRKIEIFNSNNQLCWMLEIDNAGNIVRKGELKGEYFIETAYSGNDITSKTTVTKYFSATLLMRIDSAFSSVKSFNDADTVISYVQTITKVYKLGYLLREQNRYYNRELWHGYLKWKLMVNQRKVNKKGQFVLARHIKSRFKTNYNPGKLYWCKKEILNSNFKKGNTEITYQQFERLAKCFAGKNFEQNYLKHFVKGERFYEPGQFVYYSGVCMFGVNTAIKDSTIYFNGYTFYENDLQATYYSAYKKSDQKGESERTTLYTFKYAYFEK